MYLHYCYPQSDLDKLASIIILVVSAATVIKYADYTRKMLMIQHKAYIESRNPVISFVIIPQPGSGVNLPTYVAMKNHSDFDAAVFVALDLRVKGKSIRISSPEYNGNKAWNLQARLPIVGAHFEPIPDVTAQTGLAIADLQRMWKSPNLTSKERNAVLTVAIKIKYRGSTGQIITKPTSHYYFDFSQGRWIFAV